MLLNGGFYNGKKIITQNNDKFKFKEVVLLKNATRKEILMELYNFKKKLSFKDNFLSIGLPS